MNSSDDECPSEAETVPDVVNDVPSLRQLLQSADLLLFADGMDRMCQVATDSGQQGLEFGVKKHTLQFHDVRWIVVSNSAGHIVWRSRGAVHSVSEADLLLKSGFFTMLDDAVASVMPAEGKMRVAFGCDRGYFKLDHHEITKRCATWSSPCLCRYF